MAKTNTGLNMLRDVIKGDVTDGQIKYVAWGSSNTAFNAAQTTLVAETGRHAITTRTAGATGIGTCVIYLSPDDAVTNIQEIGFFAGVAADANVNTGIMTDRFLYNKVKTNAESIQLTLTDTMGVP